MTNGHDRLASRVEGVSLVLRGESGLKLGQFYAVANIADADSGYLSSFGARAD